MRLRRPRTLLGLTLLGLALVALPLLVAVGHAVRKLDQLATASESVVLESVRSTEENQRLANLLRAMERNARQYMVLQQPDLLALYRDDQASFQQMLASLAELPQDEHTTAQLTTLDEASRQVFSALSDFGGREEMLTEIVNQFGIMATAANALAQSMRTLINGNLQTLEANARSAQQTLAWQAAALIPGTLALVVFFMFMVARPMRQIDRAISDLGQGDFDQKISVRGPHDIQQLGRQLEWLRNRLLESSNEKNKFLRHMSHELKTPLANIREGTELLMDGSVGELKDQQKEVTGILRDNGVRLQTLIENLLTFSAWQSKNTQLELRELELKPLVFGVLGQHRLAIANQNIKLQLNVQPIQVTADEGKLRLVLENLISNAIKFTPEGGILAVTACQEHSTLVLDVADSGPGIAEEDRDRVFEAFYQGRRRANSHVGGTGIGLSVVAECVQAHGGEVLLIPDNQFGAHFRVRLPLTGSETPARKVAHG
jgi:two-component system sensor histidine kinase GlrK